MFSTSQSQSQVPQGAKLQRIQSTSDSVIFVANFSRHLSNVIKIKQAFHQALFVVTKNSISSDFQYHFVEYMDDSKAYDGRIMKDKILTLKNLKDQDLKDLADFKEKSDNKEEETYNWEKMSIKKQFDIDNLYITVRDIRQKMQQIANENGQYDLFSNNCQIVADKLTEQLLLEEISQKQVLFLAQVQKQNGKFEEGESQPHPALLVAAQNFENQEYHQNYKYYIVEYLSHNKNEPYDLEFLKSFDYEEIFWETQWTIFRSEIYLKQTIQDIIDIMKKHISYFFNDSQTIVNNTFKQIQKIQDDEKKRQEAERQRKETPCEQICCILILLLIVLIMLQKI